MACALSSCHTQLANTISLDKIVDLTAYDVFVDEALNSFRLVGVTF